jgi:hypothetical protein
VVAANKRQDTSRSGGWEGKETPLKLGRGELSYAKFVVKNAAQIFLCSTSPPKFGAFGF